MGKYSNNMIPELFAFWDYDQYPYFMGGTVVNFTIDGRVITQEFGAGHTFKPVLIVPLEGGKEIAATLTALKAERQQAQKDLDADFIQKLVANLGKTLPIK
jgi:hypothetical protein